MTTNGLKIDKQVSVSYSGGFMYTGVVREGWGVLQSAIYERVSMGR